MILSSSWGRPGWGVDSLRQQVLAISLAVAAARRGRRIFYGTLADLVGSLVEAEGQGRLKLRMEFLTGASLLVVDEVGYLPVLPNGARVDRTSTSFSNW